MLKSNSREIKNLLDDAKILLNKLDLVQLFSIDLRTLALFRVAMSIAFLADIFYIWPEAVTFLGDGGLYPRQDFANDLSPHYFSLFLISGSPFFIHALLFLATLSAISLLFGYRTRAATILCWLLVVSLSVRGKVYISLADTQLSVMMFWAMFLPLGARFSIDAALSKTRPESNNYTSVATAALLLQVLYLYLMGALLKTGPTWAEGQAVYYALSISHITTPLAQYVLEFPGLMKALSYFVYYLELYCVFLLFFPYRNHVARSFVLPLLIFLHLGFALFLSIGIFPLVSISGLLAYTPALLWNKAIPWFNSRSIRTKNEIYYDKDCGFCHKVCLIFRELSLPLSTPIKPAQEYPEIYKILQKYNSWVVKDYQGNLLTRWDAVAYIWRRSPLLWFFGILFYPKFMKPVGEFLYKLIAENRGIMGRLSECLLPFRESAVFKLNTLISGLVLLLMGLVLWLNLSHIKALDISFSRYVKPLMTMLYINQKWGMFAPNPKRASTWYVIEGHRKDGTVVDLLWETEVRPDSHISPEHGFEAYPTFRWRKYLLRVKWELDDGVNFKKHYCRKYRNHNRNNRLERIIVTKYYKPTPKPDSTQPSKTIKKIVFNGLCGKK